MGIEPMTATAAPSAARAAATSLAAGAVTDRRRDRPRTLIADDQPDVLEALGLLLKLEGHETYTATSPVAVLRALETHDVDLVLMDLNYARDTTSGCEGLDLLSRIRRLDRTVPVVALTAWGSVELAVEAMRRGVSDFVEKPWDSPRLLAIVRREIERGRMRRRTAWTPPAEGAADPEMEAAGRIQRGFLPTDIPQLPGFTIAGHWQPARAVGGDYFDVLKFDEERAALCIGDAVGKGLPAAMLMLNVQATVKASASPSVAPAELCERVNRIISGQIAASSFISFFYGLLDAARRRFVYAGAGHNPPILMRRDGSHERLRAGGGLLGVAPEWSYREGCVTLLPGDRLVLFTDGVTEARDAADEEFGDRRLIELVRGARHLDASAVQERILTALRAFCPNGMQDDVTLLTLAVEEQAGEERG
jgi:phosphoserine phosphatase RsbU/P